MPFYTFNNVKVSGISVVVPENTINIMDELKYYDNNVKKVKRLQKIIGCHERRVVDKDFTMASDLAIPAANKLINDMGIERDSIDALIYLNQAPDFTGPASVFYIHNNLKLSENCAVFDITHGCVAFVYGLFLAHTMISSKQFKRILVLTADISSCGNLFDRNNAPLFGDAGACALVEWDVNNRESFFNISTLSSGYESLIAPYSSLRKILRGRMTETDFELFNDFDKLGAPLENKLNLLGPYMDGGEVFEFTMSIVPKKIEELFQFSKIKKSDIDGLCLHQANSQIVRELAGILGFDESRASSLSFEKYGNNTTCSVASIINSAYKDAIQKNGGRYILSAFGNGLTCINGVLSFDKDIYLSGVCDMDISPRLDRDEYYEYWAKKYSELQ